MRKPPMTRWYTPKLAVRTGLRVAISSIFGAFADRRDMIAASNPVASTPFDDALDYRSRSDGDEFWFDFISDTGDGFDASYAVAQMLTAPRLKLPGADQPLPRGRLLILGGDMVYPDPSRELYQDHFLDPFEQAQRELGEGLEQDLYAIPGNHDWYDGLASFNGLFARRRVAHPGSATLDRPGRTIAGRQTWQTRSYFALRLPGNWWIWAYDSQLSGYIDQSQIEYFAFAARHWMEAGSNVAIVVADPAWTDAKDAAARSRFETFDYISRLPEMVEDDAGKLMGHRTRLILSGDHHHYARYAEDGTETQLIVAGGGGAFLHPTHHLARLKQHELADAAQRKTGRTHRTFRIARDGTEEALFPCRSESRRLAWRNLAFGLLNLEMTIAFAVVYGIFNWILNAWVWAIDDLSLLTVLGNNRWLDAGLLYFGLVASSPANVILLLVGFGFFYYFAGGASVAKRLAIGGAHWLVQSVAATLTGWLALHAMGRTAGWVGNWEAVAIAIAATAAGITTTTIFGVYLLISLNGFGRHFNEAFSSLRLTKYRNLLRLRIDRDGNLTVFPIGLRAVPRGGGPITRLAPDLIETPITLRSNPQEVRS